MDQRLPAVLHAILPGRPAGSTTDQAIELVAPRKFHRVFTLPQTGKYGGLKVTYSIAGPDIGEHVPTIVFCGGMFGMRWMAIAQNWFAEQHRVRVIFIDRAGTTYALNFISHHPELLYPSNPTLTLFSPWVHQSISGELGLKAAALIPNKALDYWNNLAGSIVTKGAPAINFSAGALTATTNMLRGCRSSENSKYADGQRERDCKERFGIGQDVKAALLAMANSLFWEEETSGGNDEARLCLKSVPGTSWDRCEVYPTFVRNLNFDWEKRANQYGRKLRIKIVFGEGADLMVGHKGMKYFMNCFEPEKLGNGIEVEQWTQMGADHDTVIDPSFDSMKQLYDRVKEGWKAE
ncbi:hypothetical protein QTJ16_000247 [Diplocarpon rosae]|uniref:Uncharacterized protein n=1 Tax=Diplocarpon rosae TaxID=946125 RepID=A0AAD9T5K5_9HELO|nr:hypothetical protein QTJ16_000247 [Diplocarpon rosae]